MWLARLLLAARCVACSSLTCPVCPPLQAGVDLLSAADKADAAGKGNKRGPGKAKKKLPVGACPRESPDSFG